MKFYEMILNEQRKMIDRLESNNINCHTNFNNIDDKKLNYLALFAYLESINRATESESLPSLEEFEKSYFGTEVGNIRRYFNKVFESELDFDYPLFDFGCGGKWWKDTYWTKLKKVYGVEVNPFALLELREQYADQDKYNLICTTTGLTEFPNESFQL